MKRAFWAGIVSLLALPLAVQAGTIQVSFTGTIDFAHTFLRDAFPVGQAVAVTFQYDTLAPFDVPHHGQTSDFYVNHMSSTSMSSGGYSGVDNTGLFGQMTILNLANDEVRLRVANAANQYPTVQANAIAFPTVVSSSLTHTLVNMQVTLKAPNSAVLASAALPTTFSLSDYSSEHSIQFLFHSSSGDEALSAGITGIQVAEIGSSAPEPGTAVLVAVGCLFGFVRLHRASWLPTAVR